MASTNDGAAHRRRLIEDVLAGSRSRQDDEVEAACADQAFQRHLDALLTVQDRAHRALRDEATVAAAEPSPLDRRIVELGRRGLPRSRFRPSPGWLLLAAALLAGVLTFALWPTPPPSDFRLGNAAPLRVAAEYRAVDWDGEPGQLWFQVRVRTPDGRMLERSDLLRSNSWNPKPQDYPDEAVFELWLVDAAEEGRMITSLRVPRRGSSR